MTPESRDNLTTEEIERRVVSAAEKAKKDWIEGTGITRRQALIDIFFGSLIGASLAGSAVESLKRIPSSLLGEVLQQRRERRLRGEQSSSFVVADEDIFLGNVGASFISTPRKRTRPPGLASPERGGIPETYQLMRERPFIGISINGSFIEGIFGRSDGNPSVFRSWPLETRTSGDETFWEPNPMSVQAFIIPPGSPLDEGVCPGNVIGVHNFVLRQFGVYTGVYRTPDGSIVVGDNSSGNVPVGITRYPIAPNGVDELLFYRSIEAESGGLYPDFESEPVGFRCTWAKILSAEESNRLVYNNREPDSIFLQTCYPPEWHTEDPPPPGRTTLKLERV